MVQTNGFGDLFETPINSSIALRSCSTLVCEPLQAKLDEARKNRKLKALEELLRIAEARDKGIIDAEQALQLERDYALRRKVIMVDDFAPEELRAGR